MPAFLGHVIGTNEALIIDDRDRSHGLALLGNANRGVHDLLINLLLDDLKNGCGVFFLDPAGDAIPALLKRGDLSRLGHALFLDPTDETHSFGIHPLACRNIADLGARTDTYHRAYAVFKKLWEHEWKERPWLQLLIEHILHVFLENPDYTLAEVPLFLTNARFREHVLSAVTHHPESVDFWQEQFSPEKAAAELNRIQTLLADPTVQQIVGQKQTTIDFTAVINNSLVLLVKLSPALPKMVKRFIGTLLMSELMQTIRNQGSLPPEQRHQFCIYLNGFQDFLSIEDFAALQPQTATLNVALSLAYQEHTGPSKAAQTRLNAWLPAAHMVCFQLTAADAQTYASEFVEQTAGTGSQQETNGSFSATPVEDIWDRGHTHSDMMDIRSRYFWLVDLLRTHPHEQYFQFDPSTIPHLHKENQLQLRKDTFADWELYRSSAEMLRHGITCLNAFYSHSMQGKHDWRKAIDDEQLRLILEIIKNLGGVLGFRPTMIPCIPEAKREELAQRMQARKLQAAKTLLQRKQAHLDQLRRTGGIDYESKWWQLEMEIKQLQREIAYPASFYPGVHILPAYPAVQTLKAIKEQAIQEGLSRQEAENLVVWKIKPLSADEEKNLSSFIQLICLLMDILVDTGTFDKTTYEVEMDKICENYAQSFLEAWPPEDNADEDALVERIAWQFLEIMFFVLQCIFLSGAVLWKEPVRVPRDTGDATRRGSPTDAAHATDKTQTPTTKPGRSRRSGSGPGTPIVPKTGTDYVNDMIQELTTLPRFTAYAKVLQGQGGKQTVLRRKIQTRPLPLSIQPAEGMADLARRKAVQRGFCRECGHIEDEIRTRQEHWRGAGG